MIPHRLYLASLPPINIDTSFINISSTKLLMASHNLHSDCAHVHSCLEGFSDLH